jgi:hypothetical protein
VDVARGVSIAYSDAGATLLNANTGRYYQVNEVGAIALRELLADRSVADAVGTIGAEFDAEVSQIEADVLKLLREVEALGLVVTDGND